VRTFKQSDTGTNNSFQVNNLTPLALLYNDVSVLENHHVATLFRILTDPAVDANILAHLSKEQAKEVRAIIIKNVLGTDMSYHFESTNLFKARYGTRLCYCRREVSFPSDSAAYTLSLAKNVCAYGI
jgi:hypothetical protein